MKGIVVTSDNRVSIKDFKEPLYETVGQVVDGYIEIVNPRGLAEPFRMIVNEEGLLKNLPINIVGSLLYGTPEHGYPIVGNIVIMKQGFVDGEPDIIGLDDGECDELSQALEAFFAFFE